MSKIVGLLFVALLVSVILVAICYGNIEDPSAHIETLEWIGAGTFIVIFFGGLLLAGAFSSLVGVMAPLATSSAVGFIVSTIYAYGTVGVFSFFPTVFLISGGITLVIILICKGYAALE